MFSFLVFAIASFLKSKSKTLSRPCLVDHNNNMKELDRMTTPDDEGRALTRSCDSYISILKIRQRLAEHSDSRNCFFNQNRGKLSVSIDRLVLILRDKV